jgi:LEA14-like dessication related protein
MSIRTTTLFLFIAVSFLLASCNAIKPLEYRTLKSWKLNPGFSTSNLQVDLTFFNPNRAGVFLDQIELEIMLDGRNLGKVSQNTQMRIPGKQEFTLPLNVQLDMKNLLGNALSGLLKEKLNLRSVGKVRIAKAGIHLWVPVDVTSEVENPALR